jgi:hypothetical protein
MRNEKVAPNPSDGIVFEFMKNVSGFGGGLRFQAVSGQRSALSFILVFVVSHLEPYDGESLIIAHVLLSL